MNSRVATPLTVLFAVAALFAAFFFLSGPSARGASLLHLISDTITDSRPSVAADHTIEFQVASAIPPSGSITIGFENDAFTISSTSSYADAAFSVSTSSPSSGFVSRPLAALPDATHDGFSPAPPAGPLTFTLSSGSGITAGSYVKLFVGGGAITNPASSTSYRVTIDTYDASDALLDYGATMIAVVQPVGVSTSNLRTAPPTLSNGLPTGTIPSNITGVLLSLNTDVDATCRYATTPGVGYDSMTNTFAHTSLGTFHTANVSGFSQGTTYAYYVRCEDYQGNMNTVDYPISFTVGEPTGVPPGGGSSGGSSGGGGAPYPPAPGLISLTIQGIAFPGAKVSVLQDGAPIVPYAIADGSGIFSINVSSLPEGTYTFTLYVDDSTGNQISSYVTTVTLISGTSNSITGAVMPPSISVATDTVPLGGTVVLSGQSEPSSTVLLSVVSQQGLVDPLKASVTANQAGAWSYLLHTNGLPRDTYDITARSAASGFTNSGASKTAYLGVGQAPVPLTANPDLNGDGKVNLVDFSIFLVHWNTPYPPADFNHDGVVDLADFSIMLFHWTG